MYFRVILRRSNGRYVKEIEARSKYAAKKLQDTWEARYDNGYWVDIQPLERVLNARSGVSKKETSTFRGQCRY